MLFPIHDPYWVDTENFVQKNIKSGDRVLAPYEFWGRFPSVIGILGDLASIGEDFNIQWAIVHKGMMNEMDISVLKRITKEFIPVFSNEVFVVFSCYKRLPKVAWYSRHMISFKRMLKLRMKMWFDSNNVQQPLKKNSILKQDYSCLSVAEIKEEMDGRFSSKQDAYSFVCLWDEIRAEEVNRKVIELISPTNDKRILEIGCGIGGSAPCISECKEFVGTDLSEVAIDRANKAFGDRTNFRFLAMDAMDLKFDDRFDIVIAKEVIEHLPNPQMAIKEAYRVLKPGGSFVITSPNRDSLHLRVNRMLGYPDFKCCIDHVKEFTFVEALEMITKEEFIIKNTSGIFLMPYWGISGIDKYIRHLTDNDPNMVEMLRDLGECVGPKYAFCYVILAAKPESN